jgi:DNA-binding NarL/FixJ family response regulator
MNLLIVDDHALCREGLMHVLEKKSQATPIAWL